MLERTRARPGSVPLSDLQRAERRERAAVVVLVAGLALTATTGTAWLHHCAVVARRLGARLRRPAWWAFLALVPVVDLVAVPLVAADAWRAAHPAGPRRGVPLAVLAWWAAVVALVGLSVLVGPAPGTDLLDAVVRTETALAVTRGLVAGALAVTAAFALALTLRLLRVLDRAAATGARPG